MYKVIVEVLSSFTPVVIGAIVAYIAWQQHKTNKHRLKMELFDRRYKVYDAVITTITKRYSKFHDEIVLDLHRDISSARFLFNSDKDIMDFIGTVLSAAKDIVNFRRKAGAGFEAYSELDEEQKQTATDLRDNIFSLRQEAIEVFSKYLTLEA